jgi:hypothetical protein
MDDHALSKPDADFGRYLAAVTERDIDLLLGGGFDRLMPQGPC